MKRFFAFLLTLAMVAGLLPTGTVFAAEAPKGEGIIPDQEVSAPCDVQTILKFDLNALSGDTVVGTPSGDIGSSDANSVIQSFGFTFGQGNQNIKLTTRVHDEPRDGYIKVTAKLRNAGETYFYIHVILTGKYIVNISGVAAADSIYDGNVHTGYTGTPVGTLTSGAAYEGNDFEITYATAEGTALAEAPSAVGSYTVTFAVPETNETYKGSLTLPFRIVDPAEAEATYQSEANGEWIKTTFTDAAAKVYEGGTVKLLKDVELNSGTVLLDKSMTITSEDSASPRMLTTSANAHSYLLRIGADVQLSNVIVDGGSESGLTASRALIAVGDTSGITGKLTLSVGSIVRNNNNTTTASSGGGVCVINGELVISGGQITGNAANSGGGISMTGTDNMSLVINSGSVDNNTAKGYNAGYAYGGGVYMNGGSFTMYGGTISQNKSDNTYGDGAGVMIRQGTAFIMENGEISGNIANRCGGGLYAADVKVKVENGEITQNKASFGGAMYINPSVELTLTGGKITGNNASNYAGGIEIAPEAAVIISGDPVVDGNTSGEEGSDGGLYYDYDSSGRRDAPDVTIGELDNGAKLHWFTWMQEHLSTLADNRLLLATPADGRSSISGTDLNKMTYIDPEYDLVLQEGSMYLVQRIPATGITISPETLSLKVGETGTVTAMLTPDDTTVPITWTSSDRSVATVEDGVVTALTPGTVTITASVPGDYSAACTVTVVAEYTITYDLNGGTGATDVDYAPETVTAGTEVTVKAAPTREGYTFTGWSDGTNTYQPDDTLTVNSHITLTAQWEKDDTLVDPPIIIPIGIAKLTKVDADDNTIVLSGVVFELYRSTGRLVGTYTTDRNGEIRVSGLVAGSYYWKEISTVDGYVLDETEHSFTVSMWQTTSVVVENEQDKQSEVPDVFIDEHYAYIVGYDDGLVHPEANITRAEVATIFFRLLDDDTRNQYITRENSFSDVSADAWYNTAVSTMAAMGIVTGRPGGIFDPNANITRAEFAAIAARFDANGNTTGASFTDIYDHWANKEISIAANNGWVLGYEDGTFRPDQYITRAEAMTMVNRVLQRIPESVNDLHPDMVQWPDNMDTTKWYYLMVQEATNSHNYVRKDNGYESWLSLRETPDWTELERVTDDGQ